MHESCNSTSDGNLMRLFKKKVHWAIRQSLQESVPNAPRRFKETISQLPRILVSIIPLSSSLRFSNCS